MTALSVVVPYRGCSTGIRERNLRFVLGWLAAMPVRVVVAEHAERPSMAGSLARDVGYVHVPGSGPFAKAVACNAGFGETDEEVVAFVDADMLLDPRAVLASAERCRRDMDVIRPFGWLVDLDADASADALASGTAPQVPPAQPEVPADHRGSEQIPLCGGAFVIRRTVYEAVGGMDEEFVGWGGEDDALSIVLRRQGARCAVARRFPAAHLWHPRSGRRQHDPDYAANALRVRAWAEYSDGDFAAAVRDRTGQMRTRSPG